MGEDHPIGVANAGLEAPLNQGSHPISHPISPLSTDVSVRPHHRVHLPACELQALPGARHHAALTLSRSVGRSTSKPRAPVTREDPVTTLVVETEGDDHGRH